VPRLLLWLCLLLVSAAVVKPWGCDTLLGQTGLSVGLLLLLPLLAAAAQLLG